MPLFVSTSVCMCVGSGKTSRAPSVALILNSDIRIGVDRSRSSNYAGVLLISIAAWSARVQVDWPTMKVWTLYSLNRSAWGAYAKTEPSGWNACSGIHSATLSACIFVYSPKCNPWCIVTHMHCKALIDWPVRTDDPKGFEAHEPFGMLRQFWPTWVESVGDNLRSQRSGVVEVVSNRNHDIHSRNWKQSKLSPLIENCMLTGDSLKFCKIQFAVLYTSCDTMYRLFEIPSL